MNDIPFTNVNAIVKKKVMDTYHVYYIDDIGGFPYVADMTLKIDPRFRRIVESTSEYIIVAENYFNDHESTKKYYMRKEIAQLVISKASNG